MLKKVMSMEKQDQEGLVECVVDGFRRILVHYGLWFSEVAHQLGFENACSIEDDVWNKSLGIQMKRLGDLLGFEVDAKGIPISLKKLSPGELFEVMRALGINWLANDGVWFQAVETSIDLFTAKRCNDTCWTRFSPYEALRIKRLLDLPQQGGISALRQALGYRIYSRINKQSFEEVDDKTLVFKMVDCRVQAARKRRGLPDYPCKSAGIVEYSTFASTIDSRTRTECIACPPDDHPEEWYCAWRFTVG